jgi:ssDNA-binding replication factor A large subunit
MDLQGMKEKQYKLHSVIQDETITFCPKVGEDDVYIYTDSDRTGTSGQTNLPTAEARKFWAELVGQDYEVVTE